LIWKNKLPDDGKKKAVVQQPYFHALILCGGFDFQSRRVFSSIYPKLATTRTP